MLPAFRYAFLVLCVLTTSFSARALEVDLTPQQMREDIAFLREEWAPLDKSFSPEQRQEFERQIAAIESSADRLTPQAFALDVMRAVALARNGHTTANIGPFLGEDLPIRAWWFGDGLYVVKAHPDFARLLGARIERIGKLDVVEVDARLKPFISGTDQRIRFLSPGYLVTPSVLRHVGVIDDDAAVPVEFILADGTSETVELKRSGDDPGDERKANLNRGYSTLIPDPDDTPGRWPHVLDAVENKSKLYTPRGDVSASFLDEDKTFLYIRNDSGRSIDDTPLTDKFARIIRGAVLPNRPRHVIVDLRLHNGGDFFNSILFAQALPRLVPPDGRVFVLVGRATYSAGIVTAAMLEGEGRDRVVIIGETMSDGSSFWAEGDRLEMPHSGISLRYSTEFQNYEEGCTDPSTCYWATVAFGPRGISLEPDHRFDIGFADYAAGSDPVLEKALELAR